jgi:NADPH:quinone reductase
VDFATASTLPVAGLTTLMALERGGLLLEKSVLITGASGGVGYLACQLASQAGAIVTVQVASGALVPHIEVTAPWTEIAEVAQQLTDRQFMGKAVLHI